MKTYKAWKWWGSNGAETIPPGPNKMARRIAEQMLEQRLTQLERSNLYQRPADDRSNGNGAAGPSTTQLEGDDDRSTDAIIGLTLPVQVIALAVASLAAIVTVSVMVPGMPNALALALASLLPAGTILIGLLIVHSRERHRHGTETGARLYRELCALQGEPDPFPRDTAIALRRAENLIAQADVEVRLLTQRLLRNVGLFCVLVIPAVTVAAFQVFGDGRVQVIALGTIFEALMAVILVISRQRVRILESDLREGDYERGLLTDNENAEAQAEKLFLKHQFELKRYYDETLRQSAMLSYLGILCMAGGFVVIGVAFYLIAREEQPDAQQIMIATLAAAGGVLANFVAVLYLAMHARTVRALTGFHQRLVGTHHVHFGNLLASRVDGGVGSKVLSEMAVALASERAEQAGQSTHAHRRRSPGQFVGDMFATR